jgi:hypothetical protein
MGYDARPRPASSFIIHTSIARWLRSQLSGPKRKHPDGRPRETRQPNMADNLETGLGLRFGQKAHSAFSLGLHKSYGKRCSVLHRNDKK